jgi:hypothetical protein
MLGRLGRAVYRSRQVYHALWPAVETGHLAAAAAVLSPEAFRLFAAMEKRDQRHAIAVMNRLRAMGADDPDLIVAALLHDCGKGSVFVWLRVAKVLSPSVIRVVGSHSSPGWRGSAYRLTHHAQIGAVMAEAAGVSERAVALIRGDADPRHAPTLALLIAADDAS